jgi:hypothetical protein
MGVYISECRHIQGRPIRQNLPLFILYSFFLYNFYDFISDFKEKSVKERKEFGWKRNQFPIICIFLTLKIGRWE